MSETTKTYVEEGLSLYWEPATTVNYINHCYDRKALVALEEYFGDFPITIRTEDLRVLRAIQIAGGGRPLSDIIKAVEQEGEIRIWWDSEKRKHDLRNRHYPPRALKVED
jgi:hypothetical protein